MMYSMTIVVLRFLSSSRLNGDARLSLLNAFSNLELRIAFISLSKMSVARTTVVAKTVALMHGNGKVSSKIQQNNSHCVSLVTYR